MFFALYGMLNAGVYFVGQEFHFYFYVFGGHIWGGGDFKPCFLKTAHDLGGGDEIAGSVMSREAGGNKCDAINFMFIGEEGVIHKFLRAKRFITGNADRILA